MKKEKNRRTEKTAKGLRAEAIENRDSARYAGFMELFLTVLLSEGLWCVCADCFRFAGVWAGTAGIGCMAIVFGCFLFVGEGKKKKAGILIISLICLLMFICFRQLFYGGFIQMVNSAMEALGYADGVYRVPFASEVNEGNKMAASVAGAVFVSAAIFMLSWCFIRIGGFIYAGILFCLYISLIFSGVEAGMLPGTILISGIAAAFVWSRIKRWNGRTVSEPAGKVILISSAAGVGIFGLSAVLGTVFLPERMTEIGWIHTIRENAIEKMEEFCYGDDCLPEGNLAKVGIMDRSDETALEVIMEKTESLYLKGFVGSKYTGDRWEALDTGKRYESGELFYWLHKDGFMEETQLSRAEDVFGEKSSEYIEATVRNKSADRKYLYLPYELDSLSDKGESSYHFVTKPNLVKDYLQLAYQCMAAQTAKTDVLTQNEAYMNDEAHYNQWVYDTYTELSEDVCILLAGHLGEQSWEGRHMEYDRAKRLILTYLSEHVTYDENTEKCPEGRDFLQYVLEDTASGYDIHFATAAVLMYRYLGIPARYVEGYLITKQNAAEASAGTVFSIPQSDAHAWAEIYQDGIGWIPVETALPYFPVMEQPSDVIVSGESREEEKKVEENSKSEELGKEEEEVEYKHGRKEKQFAMSLVFLVIVLLGIMLILFFYQWRKVIKQKKNLQKSFMLSDRNRAVKNLFSYLMKILYCDGLVREGGTLWKYIPDLERRYGNVYAEKYKQALLLAEKAAYSSEEIPEEEYETVRDLEEETWKRYVKKQKWNKKLVMRWQGYIN